MLLGWLAAFAFGAVHALSPGHGKTLVAAYLVGARGTPRHAVMLGLMVTFTHTVSVFGLGLVTLYLSRFVLPETITPILGAISGLTIVWVGLMLLYRRTIGRTAAAAPAGLVHDHGDGCVHTHVPDEIGRTAAAAPAGLVHDHGDGRVHTHVPEELGRTAAAAPAGLADDHGDGRVHAHVPEELGRTAAPTSAGLVRDHGDGRVHTHVPEEVSVGSLVALGASGGLVPCPSALVLLLTSVSLGRVAYGLTLLVAFSAGLAVVLTAIGLVVLYAKHWLPTDGTVARSRVFRMLPVASAGFIVCAGIAMTWMSLR